MTTPNPESTTTQTAAITAEDMDQLIAANRAQPWTHPLRDAVPHAVLVHRDPGSTGAADEGEWYVVLDGTDHYQPAPPELAALLTRDAARLRAADQAVADVDNRHRT